MANFYDSMPPDSPLNQVDMLLDVVDYLPGYFLYPVARLMREMNLSFPYYSGIVSELTDDILVLKQAVLDAPAVPINVNLMKMNATNSKLASAPRNGTEEFWLSLIGTCKFMKTNGEWVIDTNKAGYGITIVLKGLGIILKAKGKTTWTATSIAAFGTVGANIKVDAMGGMGVVIDGLADAGLAILGSATAKLHYCDLLGVHDEIGDQVELINEQLETIGGVGDLQNVTAILTNTAALLTEHNDVKNRLEALKINHQDLDSDHTIFLARLTGVENQLDYIERCKLVKGKPPADC